MHGIYGRYLDCIVSYTYRINELPPTLQFWHWPHIVCFVYTRTAFANRFIVTFHICISCLLNAWHVDHPFNVRSWEIPRKMICLLGAFRFTLPCDCLCYIYSNFMHFVWLLPVTAVLHATRISSNQNIQYNIAAAFGRMISSLIITEISSRAHTKIPNILMKVI